MNYRIAKDKAAGALMTGFTIVSMILVVAMAIGLYLKSTDILQEHSLWDLLSASEWKPMKNHFGFLAFIMGTFYVTAVSVVIALPISLLMAVLLTEYSRSVIRRFIYPLLDILASLPAVIYGV
ncbi:MAG: phosphate ABC transporter permease subunit PstC, partial [Prevotella sp.]|nr:phosphate ABC transporter permease subunit PstC [Prevotella sp.]